MVESGQSEQPRVQLGLVNCKHLTFAGRKNAALRGNACSPFRTPVSLLLRTDAASQNALIAVRKPPRKEVIMTKQSNTAVAAKTTYEGTVITRAVQRAGRNPHLKGHIHEILAKDARNITNIFKEQSTELTRCTTATAVDLVTTKSGKVIERLQLKDSLSPSAVNKLVRQVADGKYRSTQLVGTEETTRLVNTALQKAGLKKRMVSSGISSKTTTCLAQRAGATGSSSLGAAVGQAAKSGGAVGAAVGAGIEVINGFVDLIDGKRDMGEVAGTVAKAGAKGYATGAAASAAATLGGTAIASSLVTIGAGAGFTTVATIAAPAMLAIGVGYAVSEVFNWLFD